MKNASLPYGRSSAAAASRQIWKGRQIVCSTDVQFKIHYFGQSKWRLKQKGRRDWRMTLFHAVENPIFALIPRPVMSVRNESAVDIRGHIPLPEKWFSKAKRPDTKWLTGLPDVKASLTSQHVTAEAEKKPFERNIKKDEEREC